MPVLSRPRRGHPARPRDLRPRRRSGRSGSCPTATPAFSGDEPLSVTNLGPLFRQAQASGIHEVLVLTPGSRRQLRRPRDDQVAMAMHAVRDRLAAHARNATGPLQPGHRQLRPRGRRIDPPPARPAARHPLRARRGRRRRGGLPTVLQLVRALHPRRGRGRRRLSHRARRRHLPGRVPVLVGHPVRDARAAQGTRGPPRSMPRTRRWRRSARSLRDASRRCASRSATWPTTSWCTRFPTTTTRCSTGTCTSSRGWRAWWASSRAPAC